MTTTTQRITDANNNPITVPLVRQGDAELMMHENRVYRVIDVESSQDLAEKLSTPGRTWCLCSAFRHKGLLFLNDAFSEDGAQEYAVVRESDNQQIESITFSWLSIPRAKRSIEELETAAGCPGPVVNLQTNHPLNGPCRFCA